MTRPRVRIRASAFIKELLTLASVSIVVLAARSSLASHYYVPSGSMLPTLREGDRIVVNKLAYSLRVPFTHVALAQTAEPRRGDVIVLDPPDNGELLVKRLVALPGDLVQVESGLLSLNGRAAPVRSDSEGQWETLDAGEHAIRTEDDGGPDFGPTVLPPDCYLVMGDNRGNSRDGRMFGCVKREMILGRVKGVFVRAGRPSWQKL
jgi:signal peptidase I